MTMLGKGMYSGCCQYEETYQVDGVLHVCPSMLMAKAARHYGSERVYSIAIDSTCKAAVVQGSDEEHCHRLCTEGKVGAGE